MCPSCFSSTTLLPGISLPYWPGSLNLSSPVFRGTMKMLRLPGRLSASSFGSVRGSCHRLLFRSLSPAVAATRLDICSAGRPFRLFFRQPRPGSPVFPLNPLQVCHVLRPRRNFHAKPLRRFGAVPRHHKSGGLPLYGHFGIQSHGFPARCVRFVPSLLPTTQHSLSGWWLTFSGRDYACSFLHDYPQGYIERFR